MIDSTRLSSFRVFAEELSFTKAAARLHISQPALHVQISKLAESLGVALYRRNGRALALTPAGRDLLGFARDSERRTETFLASLGRATPRTVVLAAGEGTLLFVLGDAIRRAARSVDLRIVSRDRDGVLAALRTGEAHIGVTALATAPDDLAAVRLRTVGMSAVMPRGHRLAKKRTLRLADLAGERLIVTPSGGPHREQLERMLAAGNVAWERAVEASGWTLILHYAALGIGVAIVNDTCRAPAGAVARAVPELPSLAYWLLHRRDLDDFDPATELRAPIVDAFRATPLLGKR
jgi:LysR family transcriptional regulator, low CO2-responsive transcriptional regulator